MGKRYDLEERTEKFAKECRVLIRLMPRDIPNNEDGKQLARSSGSVAANYIEANEALSPNDFKFRLKVCRKESKESRLWLNLLQIPEGDLDTKRNFLKGEATQLIKIFNTIISKLPPS